MKKIAEMTMKEMLTTLNESVDKYNATTNMAERIELGAYHTELVKAYNEAAVVAAYAVAMKDKEPVVALAKKFYCEKVAVADKPTKDVDDNGKTVVKIVRSVSESTQKLNVVKFIDWAADHNKKIAADNKKWKNKMFAARDTINGEWKKFMDSTDGYKMSKNAVKKSLQSMFDAMAFVPSEKDKEKNAIVARTNEANFIVALAAKAKVTIENGKVSHSITFLKASNMADIVTDLLHMAVEGKSFEVIYGDPAEGDTEEKPEAKKPEAKK